MDSKIYIETVRVFFDMLPGDPVGLPDDFFSFVFVLNVCGIDEERGAERAKRQGVRDKGRGARGEKVLRGLSARFWEGLGNEGDADYADCADYADFEMCLDCLDVILKPRICANARESGFEGRRDRFAVRSAAPVRSLRCETAFGCETGLEGEVRRGGGRGVRGEGRKELRDKN
jgi:hypothetical protein